MNNNLQRWRLIRDKDYDGSTNMAIDNVISIACGKGKSLTTVRFYGWKKPTLTIGYGQRTGDDINLEYCESAGIEIVRRPTGGRAVLHEKELTFSVCASIKSPFFPKNIVESHKKISDALLLGINNLGIKANLQHKTGKLTKRNPVCFSTPSIYELVVDGKKIIGCAQRRFKKSILEHGSIPLELDRNKLFNIFRNSSAISGKDASVNNFKNMAGLNELSVSQYTLDQVKENIIKGFEQSFGIAFKEESLSLYEEELVNEIQDNS